MNEKVSVKDKGEVVLLENRAGGSVGSGFLRHPGYVGRRCVKHPRSYIRLIDETACMVFLWKTYFASGWGARKTRVLHKWHPKSVLRRVGVR